LALTHARALATLAANSTNSMRTKTVALVSICVAAATFTACKTYVAPVAVAGLPVAPGPNNLNAALTIRLASGALGTIERLEPALDGFWRRTP